MSPDGPHLWSIVESRFDPRTAKSYEGLFTLGSGYLHVRGSLEEHLAGQPQNVEYTRRPANVTSETFREVLAQWGTYIPGVFARHPLLNNQMVNLPWPLELAPVVDGERLDMHHSELLAYQRTLSLRDAVLRRTLTWRTRSGVLVEVAFDRFVSAARPHLIVQRLALRPDRPCEVAVHAGLDAGVRTNGFSHFAAIESRAAADHLNCEVATDAGDRVSLTSRVWPDGPAAPGQSTPHQEAARCGFSLACPVPADRPVTIHKRTWITTSRDPRPADPTALEHACAASYEHLLAEHAAEWARRWESCDVRIEGDPTSQLAMRTALFHLLRAHVPDDRVAIDAKGYAGEAYWGRYFWDTELFLLPFFAYTDPARARTLADFRVHTLDGARRNAARSGYPGARYAWESDHLGDECCPNWQYADHEVHITADVAHGLAHHAAASADPAYLRGPAAAVILDTARYWMERITFDDRRTLARPRLLGVMGPDEYKPITSDNAYTNRMVAFALDLAARIGPHAGATESECAAWRTTAAALPIPRTPSGKLILQCDGFDRLADPEFDRLWLDRSRTFAAQVPQERLYRSKCLKQADVLMLMALFPGEFTDAEVRAAWDYYLPYTTHDSSLSAGVHCLIACRLGLTDAAWSFWQRASRIDLPIADGGHGGAAEGIHIAAAGAVWQMAVMGFAGLRSATQADELTLAPRLPAPWQRLSFPLIWRGQPVHIELEPTRTRIHNRSAAPLPAIVGATRRTIAPGAEEVFA